MLHRNINFKTFAQSNELKNQISLTSQRSKFHSTVADALQKLHL